MLPSRCPEFFTQPNDFLVFPDRSEGEILFAHLKLAWLISRGYEIDEDVLSAVEDHATPLGKPRIDMLANTWNQAFVRAESEAEADAGELTQRRLGFQELLISEILHAYGDGQPSSVRARKKALQEAELSYFGAVLNQELH